MAEFCYACAAPLSSPDFKGPHEDYCRYCVDESGNLKDAESIKQGIAHWFRTWQPNITEEQSLERAGHYMKSMPAWADK